MKTPKKLHNPAGAPVKNLPSGWQFPARMPKYGAEVLIWRSLDKDWGYTYCTRLPFSTYLVRAPRRRKGRK